MNEVTNSDDFAVVIGISHYPFLGNIAGPEDDAKAVADWLMDSLGGGLPRNHVMLLTSDAAAKPGKKNARPTIHDVNEAFEWVMKDRTQRQERIGRRLYIYLAGHGYGVNQPEPALLMADASFKTEEHSIDASAYADSFLHTGMFKEVVLFADCALTTHQGRPSAPPWATASVISLPPGTQSFYASNSLRIDAHTPLTGDEIKPQGLLTQALLEGLRGGAVGADGRITSATLGDYMSDRLTLISEGRQRVSVNIEGDRPIVFVGPAESVEQSEGLPRRASQRRPSEGEWVVTQADDPAIVDELYRRPFAEVVAVRMDEVWKAQSEKQNGSPRSSVLVRLFKRHPQIEKKNGGDHSPVGAFMIHIHGPWGAGKTSVLNFLRQHLQDERRVSAPRWVVVEFNAWRNQRIRPPWWTLIKEIYTQTAQQLGLVRSLWLRAQWLFWRARADWIPVLLTALLIVGVVMVATGVIHLGHPQLPADNVAPAGGALDETGKAVELGLKILGAAFVAAATVFAFSRSLVFGSARAAQTYTELRNDPLRPIVRLFMKLVKATGRPVAVFIDDLDRCDSKYVIELLEGIQTLFRTAPVTYVVAADRKWICSSFEKGFEDFGKTIGGPGRPLGYLFLDKVFQVSASIPRLTPEVQRTYMNGLLRAAASADPKVLDETRKRAEREAIETVKDAHTQEELEEKIAEVQNDPVKEPAMRAAAARQITRPEAQRQTEHRLQRFADLLEPNPRSMKRLVNAYGLHQAIYFLEGRSISPEALARWTILELRWPLLADLLVARPQLITDLSSGSAPTSKSIPADLKKLFGDEEVSGVIGVNGAKDSGVLDEAAVREIVGLVRAVGPLAATTTDQPSGSSAAN
jgi:hypothetical protein